MTTCKVCQNNRIIATHRMRLNNPNGIQVTMGQDIGAKRTLGELVTLIVMACKVSDDDQLVSDLLDEQFLMGCWAHVFGIEDPSLLRDVRGLLIGLGRRAV